MWSELLFAVNSNWTEIAVAVKLKSLATLVWTMEGKVIVPIETIFFHFTNLFKFFFEIFWARGAVTLAIVRWRTKSFRLQTYKKEIFSIEMPIAAPFMNRIATNRFYDIHYIPWYTIDFIPSFDTLHIISCNK